MVSKLNITKGFFLRFWQFFEVLSTLRFYIHFPAIPVKIPTIFLWGEKNAEICFKGF